MPFEKLGRLLKNTNKIRVRKSLMKKTSEILIKKTGLIILSTMMMAFGISLFLESKLGSDPVSVWSDGLGNTLNIAVGNANMIHNIFLLVLVLVFARRFVQWGTAINAVTLGLFMNLFGPMILQVVGPQPSLVIRGIMLAMGLTALCFGVALNLTTQFGFTVAEGLIVQISEKFKVKYRTIKMLFDFIHTAGGVLMGGVFGVGSVLAVLTGGPLISFFRTHGAEQMVKAFKIPEKQ